MNQAVQPKPEVRRLRRLIAPSIRTIRSEISSVDAGPGDIARYLESNLFIETNNLCGYFVLHIPEKLALACCFGSAIVGGSLFR